MTADKYAYRVSYCLMVCGSFALAIMGQLPAIKAVIQNW